MAIDPYANCNFDIISNDLCTLETCCLAQSSFLYIPNYGANLFFAILFAILIVPQLGLGIYYKTWGFMVGMLFGLALEVVGYVARVQLHDNPFNGDAFLMYLVTLTIAPVFISAAIYLCLTRLLVIYGQENSRFKPRTIALTFMLSDFLSLVLQAAGGGIADTADDKSTSRMGIDIMIAGLVLQAVSLAAFLLFCADFFYRSSRGRMNSASDKVAVRSRPLFKAFLVSLLLATVVILIRSIFRAAELWEGFDGKLWNNETDFLVLDGAMIGIASLLLCVFHPGPAFQGQWAAADWKFRTSKGSRNSSEELMPQVGRSKEMRREYDSDA